MKCKISDDCRPGSPSLPPRLCPQTAGNGGGIARASPELEDRRRVAKEAGGRVEAGFPVENEYPLEGNGGREVGSDEYKEDSNEKDDDEDVEVDEPEAVSEQDAVVPFAEEDRPKLDDGFYEIEAIRKKRVIKGEPKYFIKWRGWPESTNTWEPLEHLSSCPNVVEAFEKSLNSRKRACKRKGKSTQSKKTLQKSDASISSRDERISKLEKRTFEGGPSCTSASNETRTIDYSIDKDNVQVDVTIPLEEAAKGDGSGSTEANQSEHRIGAKRRKSGKVQRFRPEQSSSDPRLAQHQIASIVDSYPTISLSRDNATVSRILKSTSITAAKTNDVQDVLITFLVMRSDGTEMIVDNKFLKANYPELLINFYEKHLRYVPT